MTKLVNFSIGCDPGKVNTGLSVVMVHESDLEIIFFGSLSILFEVKSEAYEGVNLARFAMGKVINHCYKQAKKHGFSKEEVDITLSIERFQARGRFASGIAESANLAIGGYLCAASDAKLSKVNLFTPPEWKNAVNRHMNDKKGLDKLYKLVKYKHALDGLFIALHGIDMLYLVEESAEAITSDFIQTQLRSRQDVLGNL